MTAEAAIVPAPRRFAPDVLEALPLGVVLFDAQLLVVWRNETARTMLGEQTDLPAALAADIVESRYEDWSTNLRHIFSGQPRRYEHLMLRRDGGDPRHVTLHGSAAVAGESPQQRIGVLLVEDVTARVTMEQRLAVSDRLAAVGKLCAQVAHELNNPLDGILRFQNLALRLADEAESGKLREYIQSARDGTLRLTQIVRALLDFSRRTPPLAADQGVDRLLDEAVRTFESRAAEYGVGLFCHYRGRDLPAVGGSNLFQVFCNLIKNAIDAMPNGGSLVISAGIEGSEVVVRFSDTGVGLPPDTDRIFLPFFTTKPPGQGTGLGLAVCREIVERLGGRIAASDRPDGPGAIFTVRLPAPAAAIPVAEALPASAKAAPGRTPPSEPQGA